ncbi:hypothetical protein A2767_05405 [Candidatus Roizmanbacteria bacterium RIFCSPHIGHO2_01_FULL_35_10]|uniref:EfeO-type cupredoxin-like domain-containing protein n=1 Tax=Candidatus Roizmanbacteria bacterium RIFCSPLOWO2_01_FULL_35_13 TaxID=1802055 RepID=A0A1F7IBJ9_9BACT|nr:MAG: hypothetical protein A2767_05405 [Candidatus Roizmanbacteria bacterium RIFCSPHIGHO2_01_FULL_35_10]OGK40728.1 MAG: hypothetical protein A3A74_03875 [Candidatus Roizmanbacteria bacterium RIFCSPLOWO2_01_FULL_35_13]
MDKILVGLFSVAGMFFTYWFFLMKKEDVISVTDSVDITVEGGYSPNIISISLGKTIKINFFRKDPSSCLEEVVLGDFKIRKYLPLNQKITIEVTAKEKGEFAFTCGMGMFHGKIVVSD